MARSSELKKIAKNYMDHSKRPKRVYALHKNLFFKWTRFFPDLQSLQERSKYSVLNYFWLSGKSNAKILSNIRSKSKKRHFWHVFLIIEWSRFFPGNPAVSLFFLYHPLTSCKKAKKSYARFSRFRGWRTDGLTDRLTNIPRPDLNWSWEFPDLGSTKVETMALGPCCSWGQVWEC